MWSRFSWTENVRPVKTARLFTPGILSRSPFPPPPRFLKLLVTENEKITFRPAAYVYTQTDAKPSTISRRSGGTAVRYEPINNYTRRARKHSATARPDASRIYIIHS